MQIEYLEIREVFLIKPKIYYDSRGCFFESFNEAKFNELTKLDIRFVQDNVSYSKKNVLRGLHFQRPPFEQAKLVQVLSGRVIDIVVDIRKKSPTFGKCLRVDLSSDNHFQLFIPRGFAHGFLALTENVIFSYKCDNYYSPQHEDGILFSDNDLDICLGYKIEECILSEKDLQLNGIDALKNEK